MSLRLLAIIGGVGLLGAGLVAWGSARVETGAPAPPAEAALSIADATKMPGITSPAPASRDGGGQLDEGKLLGHWEHQQTVQQLTITTTIAFAADHTFEQRVTLPIGTIRKTGQWSLAGSRVALNETACAFDGKPDAPGADLTTQICNERVSDHTVELDGDELRVASGHSGRPTFMMRRR